MDGRQTWRHGRPIDKRGQGIGCAEERQGRRQAAKGGNSGRGWRSLTMFISARLDGGER